MKFKTSFITLIGLCSVACDDTTDTIGIFTDSDNINASTSVYEASTQSLLADSVLSNSNSSYLGRMTDPETNMQIKAEFLAQFSTLENYEFPAYDLMVKNEQGEIEADSIEIRLYYEKYYGDENNPMKVDVYELDTANVRARGHYVLQQCRFQPVYSTVTQRVPLRERSSRQRISRCRTTIWKAAHTLRTYVSCCLKNTVHSS